jgi:hypothetical protein
MTSLETSTTRFIKRTALSNLSLFDISNILDIYAGVPKLRLDAHAHGIFILGFSILSFLGASDNVGGGLHRLHK